MKKIILTLLTLGLSQQASAEVSMKCLLTQDYVNQHVWCEAESRYEGGDHDLFVDPRKGQCSTKNFSLQAQYSVGSNFVWLVLRENNSDGTYREKKPLVMVESVLGEEKVTSLYGNSSSGIQYSVVCKVTDSQIGK